MGYYTDITRIVAPVEASLYDRIDPEVTVRNLAGFDLQVRVWAVWFVGAQQQNAIMNPHDPVMTPLGLQKFTLPVLMPENDITLGFWVYYLQWAYPEEWVLDSYAEHPVQLVTQTEAVFSDFKIYDYRKV